MTIRPMHAGDLAAVLAINERNADDVGTINADDLAGIFDTSRIALVAVGPENELVGFCLVIDGTCHPKTPRAAWALAEAGGDLHLERVSFDMQFSGYGLGRALYEQLDEQIETIAASSSSRAVTLTSLIRRDPPNEHSIGFHATRGFETVAEAVFDGTTIGVAIKTFTA